MDYNMKDWKVKLEFNKRKCFIGVTRTRYNIYIYPFPCVCIHFSNMKKQVEDVKEYVSAPVGRVISVDKENDTIIVQLD